MPDASAADRRKRIFHDMLRLRLIEQRVAALYPEWDIRCPTHFCIGQEAIAVAACAPLGVQDIVTSAHRSHGHYLAKGGDLKAFMAELYGKATGCARGKGGSMHLIDLSVGFLGTVPIVGATIPIGVGSAFASKMIGDGLVTVAFFGDGAAETGVFHESLSFARLHDLPIVFICENNGFSVLTPLEPRQPKGRTIAQLGDAHAVPSFRGDGNDADEVFRLSVQAIDLARRGGGPTLLEFETYRWLEHCGPVYDRDAPYRAGSDYDGWVARDPVATYRKRLGLADAEVAAMTKSIEAEIDAAVQFAKQSPFPTRDQMLSQVFAQTRSELRA